MLNATHADQAYVQSLLSSLVGEWLLGCRPIRRIHTSQDNTALSKWHQAMMDKFSKECLAGLTPELSNAVHYNLALALFDHVKVEFENSGQSGAIKNLCVRCRMRT